MITICTLASQSYMDYILPIIKKNALWNFNKSDNQCKLSISNIRNKIQSNIVDLNQ